VQGFFSSKMLKNMILRSSEILAQIATGKSNAWIARNSGHGRSLIREIRAALNADTSTCKTAHVSTQPPQRWNI
jgi:hypothetical protein